MLPKVEPKKQKNQHITNPCMITCHIFLHLSAFHAKPGKSFILQVIQASIISLFVPKTQTGRTHIKKNKTDWKKVAVQT